MTGDEDDRHVGTFDCNSLLELEAIDAGKREVKYEATRDTGAGAIEEFLGGRERLGAPAFVLDQQFQRLAHGDVVINDKNNWRGRRHGYWPQFMPGYVR